MLMNAVLSKQEIEAEIARLAPFHHKVKLPYNLSTHIKELSKRPVELTRVSNLIKHAFPRLLEACGGSFKGKRVLDIACNCGGFSVEAAKYESDFTLGIDMMDQYIEQANFIKNSLQLDQVEFKKMNVDQISESSVGLFDVTFCFGILYHFENPIDAMKRIASVTKKYMLVDTKILLPPNSESSFFKKPIWEMDLPLVSSNKSIDSTTSKWRSKTPVAQFNPNENAVFKLLEFLGFSKVEKLSPLQNGLEERYYNGNRCTFLAVR